MQILPQPNAPTEIEDALQRLQRAIERLWQLAEDGGDTWDAHQAERALQCIREVLHACNARKTSSKP
jgi:hypothetical protein